jgi:glycine/D-amino acid oxidase-like deaminating enzyme
MPDVIVVGAGVVGASIAYRLARAGARVMLLDRGAPGGGTSATSFAWVNSNAKTPLAYHRLNAEGIAAHRRLRDALGEAPWLHEGGNLEWVDDEPGRERLLAKIERLRAWDYAVQLLDAAHARELEPHLCFDGMVAAAYYPDEAWIEGPALAQELAAAAARLGAQAHSHTPIADLERTGERVTGVRLAAGERLMADWVVIAAGRWTDQVAATAGVRVPLAPTCGLLAVTSPVTPLVSRVIHAPRVHFRPEPGSRLVLQDESTDATVGPDTPPDLALPGCTELLRRARRYVPALAHATVAEARVGIRPMPADGFPIVGPVAGRPGLYLAVTHSGITLCALLGELVAQEITTGQPDERLAPFRPQRCVELV